MPKSDSTFKKATYRISAEITSEEIARRADTITEAEIATAEYLRKLHLSPDITLFPPYCFYRYRG